MPKAPPRKPDGAKDSFALSKGTIQCIAGVLVFAVVCGLSQYFSPSGEDAIVPASIPGAKKSAGPSAVTALDDTNFDEFVAQHPEGVLVDFFSQDCGFCTKLAPEYEAAAKEIRATGGPPLAVLDSATGAQVIQKLGIERYPTVLWLWRGENVMELQRVSEKPAAKIIEWARWAATPAVQELDTLAEFEGALATLRSTLHAKARLMVAFHSADGDGMRDALEATAQRHRTTTVFLYIKEAGATGPSLRSYGQEESKDEDYQGAPNRDDVNQWVKGTLEKAKPKEAAKSPDPPADPKSAATKALKQAQLNAEADSNGKADEA